MDNQRKQELLVEGGDFLKVAETLRDISDDALELNETAARNLLVNKSEGKFVSSSLTNTAQQMLLMIDFVRSMKAVTYHGAQQR